MFVTTAVAFAAAATNPHVERFRTKWQPDLQTTMADAALDAENIEYPSHCSLAVVGAGWGGAYLAWRMAVDTNTVNASEVCVFEANGRVGGRIYSIHGLPNFADLAVDVGGYRFQSRQKLPNDLVFNALKMSTACYDWQCAQNCEEDVCYVNRDSYGNNAGYATNIEEMLGRLEAAGRAVEPSRRQVYFAARLTKISTAPLVGKTASRLHFANGKSVTADRVVLNLPGNAIEGLDPTSTIFTHATKNVTNILDSVYVGSMNKVYAWYNDAWWSTKLGMMEGYFTGHGGKTHKFDAPLQGRYHDGPQRCIIGHDTAGEPVYSGHKMPYGNCSGAIEVYYTHSAKYYENYMTSPLQPLTVAVRAGTNGSDLTRVGVEANGASDDVALLPADKAKKLITDIHEHLMSHHASDLTKAGVDPSTIELPETVVLSNWISDGKYTPGIGRLIPGTDAQKALVRKPTPMELYVVDQDYGYQSGWAVGSLAMAEKILQAEIGLKKPDWLDETWYKEWVLAVA